MTSFLVQAALSNLLISAALAGVAYLVHRQGRYPMVAHVLWVIVLVKLITPPFFALTLARLPASGPAGPAGAEPGLLASVGLAAGPLLDGVVAGLLATWAIGSIVVLLASLVRIIRFDRLLRRTSSPVTPQLQWLAGDVARELGMGAAPRLFVTSARISPMTWWTGGRVRIVLPTTLPGELEVDQLRWVLAHELAHVKRHDHLVRWLEWLACVAFWWNPVAWFARANLRLDEEAACDALVVQRLDAAPKPYARALLAVAEHLARPAVQPPAVATGIDGGGSLERRFRLLLSDRGAQRVPRALTAGILGLSLLAMPLGVGIATEDALDLAGIDRWLADDVQVSSVETAFLAAMAAPRGLDRTAPKAEPTTAKVSGKITKKQAAKRAKVKRAEARKAKQAKAKRAKARAERKAARAAARAARDVIMVPVPPLSPVLRF